MTSHPASASSGPIVSGIGRRSGIVLSLLYGGWFSVKTELCTRVDFLHLILICDQVQNRNLLHSINSQYYFARNLFPT
jgi:hypothetical protein